MAHIQYVDSLVREYMLFRGFAGSLKAFDGELKTDKDKGFRVDKIIEHITHAINVHDLAAVRDMWSHLDGHLFSKLEHSFTSAVKKLECGILKLYLVIAFTAGKTDKISEFFNKMASELHAQSEWKEWFFFPFCKNPEEHPIFAVCFSKQWQDTLLISLHNFLATIFQCMPQPTLARADTEAQLVRKLQEENAALRSRLQALVAPTAAAAAGASSQPSSTHQSRLTSYHSQTAAAATPTNAPLQPASLHLDNHHLQQQQQQQRSASRTNTAAANSATATPTHHHHTSSLADIQAPVIPPPTHIVDDFYIIAMETLQHGQQSEGQARGLRSLIKQIGSGGAGSPVMGRRESLDRQQQRQRRSGSTGSGRSWTQMH